VDCSNQAEGKDTRLAVVNAAMNLQAERKSRVPTCGNVEPFRPINTSDVSKDRATSNSGSSCPRTAHEDVTQITHTQATSSYK
jgi:hypothetical protein